MEVLIIVVVVLAALAFTLASWGARQRNERLATEYELLALQHAITHSAQDQPPGSGMFGCLLSVLVLAILVVLVLMIVLL